MRVLLTGSSGQIGRAISLRLSEAGHDVIGLSRGSPRVPGSDRRHICATMGTPEFVSRIATEIEPCNAIVHAAALLRGSDTDLALSNCVGTSQVVDLAHAWHSEAIVYISSVPVIGKPVHLPITEEHPTAPVTGYHTTKLFGEFVINGACKQGICACSLRVTSPCGPGTPETRIAGAFVRHALQSEPLLLLGSGGRKQDYVDVRDVAIAVQRALDLRFTGILNIASSKRITNYALALLCIAELNSSSEICFDGRPDPEEDIDWHVCIEKARREIGYIPQFTIEDSIRAIALEYSHTSHQ